MSNVNAIVEPHQPEEITADILTRWLREAGDIKDSKVVSLVRTPLNCIAGFLSTMWRLNLEYDFVEVNAPRTLVVKAETDVVQLRKLGNEFHAFDHEVRFYKEVAPSCPIRVPQCYYSWCDEDGDGMIVFEDLSALEGGDQVLGLTHDQALHTVGAIAQFHARWWQSAELLEMTWVPEHTYMLAQSYDEYWPQFATYYRERMSAGMLRQGEAVYRNMNSLIAEAHSRPVTLCHADLRADNLRINRSTGEVLILDWQLLFKGLGIFDVARLIGGSMQESLDREGHRAMWTHWHQVASSHGVTGYSLADVEKDYKLGMLIALHIPVLNHTLMDRSIERSAALVDSMIRRFFHAAEQIDAASR